MPFDNPTCKICKLLDLGFGERFLKLLLIYVSKTFTYLCLSKVEEPRADKSGYTGPIIHIMAVADNTKAMTKTVKFA